MGLSRSRVASFKDVGSRRAARQVGATAIATPSHSGSGRRQILPRTRMASSSVSFIASSGDIAPARTAWTASRNLSEMAGASHGRHA